MLNSFSVTRKGMKEPDCIEIETEHVAPRGSSRRDYKSMEKQRLWKLVFDRYDGKIPIENVTTSTVQETNAHDLHSNLIAETVERADWKKKDFIIRDEFDPLVVAEDFDQIPNCRCFLRDAAFFIVSLLLGGVILRNPAIGIRQYVDHYNCMQLPIFLFLISLLQIAVYVYYCMKMNNFTTGDSFLHQSLLVYNPCRKKEVWRYVTYMFTHTDASHVMFNVICQLLIGIPLELMHSWWRVGLVYLAGVLSGSLMFSVLYPTVYATGSSSGVYALIGAHLANAIVNFQEMEYRFFQLASLILITLVEFGIALVRRKISRSQAVHMWGALAGLSVGVVILRNLRVHPWEIILGFIMLYIYLLLVMSAVCLNDAF